jgi:hypothetical protein
MLERGHRGPQPHFSQHPGQGLLVDRPRMLQALSLSVLFRLVDLVEASQSGCLLVYGNPVGLVGASDSDRLARVLTVNAYR